MLRECDTCRWRDTTDHFVSRPLAEAQNLALEIAPALVGIGSGDDEYQVITLRTIPHSR